MEWRRKKSDISSEDISIVEEFFKIKFSEDFIKLALINNGARPLGKVLNKDGNKYVFYSLISLNKNDEYNIFKIYQWIKKELRDGLIPIADDPFGNYYCYDKSNKMKIIFWEQESRKEFFIDNNINSFINNFKK